MKTAMVRYSNLGMVRVALSEASSRNVAGEWLMLEV